jgi:hypothetical protein
MPNYDFNDSVRLAYHGDVSQYGFELGLLLVRIDDATGMDGCSASHAQALLDTLTGMVPPNHRAHLDREVNALVARAENQCRLQISGFYSL